MEKLTISSTPSSSTIPSSLLSHSLPITSRASSSRRRVSFYPLNNPKKFSVFASKNDPDNNQLNQWDLMELKFGRMLGEDPKLTIAKIKGRKANPDASYIEIEKNFYKNKGKLVEVKEVPFDVPEKLGSVKASNGLNLVKPVPKKGIKVGGGEDNSKLPEIKRPSESIRKKESGVTKSSVPNVILRKPSVFNEKDDETDSSSRLRIKPNLSLSMRTEPVKEKFSGMTLLKRPEPVNMDEDHDGENGDSVRNGSVYGGDTNGATNDFEGDRLNGGQGSVTNSGELTLLQKPNAVMRQSAEEKGSSYGSGGTASVVVGHIEGLADSKSDSVSKQDQLGEDSQREMQHREQTDVGYSGEERKTYKNSTVESSGFEPINSALLGRPKRLDQSVKEMSYPTQEEAVSGSPEGCDGEDEQDKRPVPRPLKETEEIDWRRVEQSFNLGHRVEVELVSCSPRGFVVSYGSLIGFLPYRNLAAKWKFLVFESWLRRNGLDPSNYRQNLGIIGNDDFQNKSTSQESSLFPEVGQKAKFEVTADMKLEELLRIYDLEKIQYLSSYLSQQIKVNILLADRNSRKLIFSMRPKERDEVVERKRKLMAKLSIGDVVKCCIKKITYFGIFVEVEEVPALIHQTEVSWDSTLDPSSYLKIGQIVEAKVYQLDFASERIFLSLKEITPDPLNEALECIVGNNSFDGGLEAAQADTEWTEVDLLIKELEKIDGIETVTKGRYFLSPGLAPTFQVYMASMFENQYKLLARSGNRVQEIMVEASLEKEEMKSAILDCTNRVEL